MKRKIVFTLAFIIVLLALAAAYYYFKKTPDVVNNTPEVTITAKELVAAFEQDTAAASQRYLDKVVQVWGNVKRVDTAGAVVLGEDGSPSEVVVGFDRRHIDDYKQLQVGQPAVMQGICSGYTKSGSSDPTDLLAALGTTVQLRSAGVKAKE